MLNDRYDKLFRSTKTLSTLAVGTILYNIVPTAVGIIPVTRVDPSKDQLSPEWLAGSPLGKKGQQASTSTEKPKDINPASAPESSDVSEKNSSHPTGPHGSKLIEQDLYEGGIGTKKTYDPHVMAGLPVGIQIVGRLFDDEKVIEMMQVVEDALGDPKSRGFGPGTSERYI